MAYSDAQWRSYHHLHFIVLQNAQKGLEQVTNRQIVSELIKPEKIKEQRHLSVKKK